ncbi:MAG TPA: hypothetical protein VIR58_11695 [Acidimicrobiales bacterium]
MRFPKRDMPARIATGAFILHAGWEKWRGDEETAKGIHGMAVGTYPFLKDMEPTRFLKLLAAAEIGVGTALLAPFVPSRLAGTALTGFGTGLLGLYARTPGLRREGSIWPTQSGIGISKDSWLVGIGLSLMASHDADDAES